MFDALIVNGSPTGTDQGLVDVLADMSSFVVAADFGVGYLLASGRVPDIVVGDMDSVPEHMIARIAELGIPTLRVNPVKDDTDLQLAIERASKESGRVAVTGFSGGRLDHELAAIGDMARSACVTMAVDSNCAIVFLRAGQTLELASVGLLPDDEYSVMACLGRTVVNQQGVFYPQERGVLEGLSGLGVSNVVVDRSACVECVHGTVAIVLTY